MGDGGGVEVEAEAVRRHERTLLGGVGTDDLVQSPVEKVGRGVMRLDGTATGRFHLQGHDVGSFVRKFSDLQHGRLAHAEDGEHGDVFPVRDEDAGVAELAALLDVEGTAVDDGEGA